MDKDISSEKDKNEPGRFLGEGVSFRAKLIGVLEVPEARGDRMCQEALGDLKMAIRAAGEHKQRIQVHVAIDGLRLRDDKTGDSLYHHPVHKISFIAQDMTDSRAFGYIFGSPDTGHRFFGIKTDKAASQVVIAMRDLFQVVFELKKKEIELAKQQLEGKNVSSNLSRHNATVVSEIVKASKNVASSTEPNASSSKAVETAADNGVAELVDLEQELSSLRRGLTIVEGLTPSTDPFGDSFTMPAQAGLLPPPPSSATSSRGRTTSATSTPRAPPPPFSPSKPANTSTSTNTLPFDMAPVAADFAETPVSLVDNLNEPTISSNIPLSYDVFTELDPLGTGRSKPYVDKKLFFQELKNPPKKVLKDLVPITNSSNTSLLSDILPTVSTTIETVKGETTYSATTITSVPRQSGGSVSIVKTPGSLYSGSLFASDPFAETDPFDSTDPFSESFKDDPFITNIPDFPKSSVCNEDVKSKPSRDAVEKNVKIVNVRNVFNGPLQVTLPPETVPKSPRLQRQSTESGSIRQRPQPSNKMAMECASPPPPLPPKKAGEVASSKPPPRPPHEHEHVDSGAESGPPLPRPARRREPTADRRTKPRLSSAATNSSEDEYLTPVPPPLPGGRRFDITLSQLLTCGLDELATRLRVPAASLSSMTLAQLTTYVRSYLAADSERVNIHVESSPPYVQEQQKPDTTPAVTKKPIVELKPQFEDNFTHSNDTNGFVADFEDFDKKANPSYDRYAAFREIQEQELNTQSILNTTDDNDEQIEEEDERVDDSDEKEEIQINNINLKQELAPNERDRDGSSPLRSLDELTMVSINMFRSSVSPKPTQMEAKIEDIKSVMKNLQIEQSRRSVSPRDNGNIVIDPKPSKGSDRYAALREITITEPQDEFESIPSERKELSVKERKKSDEKSDGFDNSDFFDCIDNSSLHYIHVEDAFKKSHALKDKKIVCDIKKEDKKKEFLQPIEVIGEPQPPTRLSTGSMSEIASGSSPDTKDKSTSRVSGGRWSVLAAHWSSDSEPRLSPPRSRRRPRDYNCRSRQTSSSSRDVSPWEDEPPPPRHHRGHSHHRDSRHNSSGSRECLDSGSGRDKEKINKREIRDRESRDSGSNRERDRRDSGSGRDRARDISKERDHRETRDRRDRRSRDMDKEMWDRDRDYSRERDYRDSRSRERLGKEYREKERERHRKPTFSWEDEEEYSDGCGSGRSSPRERWSELRWRRDERVYGSLGWRETRRRAELRQTEENPDRRYGATMSWTNRRTASTGSSTKSREMERRRQKRDERVTHRQVGRGQRFSDDVATREARAPFNNDFVEVPPVASRKRDPYETLEVTRFAFDPEDTIASPLSAGSRARDGDSPATRFRFDSDSVSPRSMFEDDFTTVSTPRARAASIAEEDEEDLPPLRSKPVVTQQHRDIKKSESVNIFVRETDPFEGDDFFACTGSDRAARRENWPGDFQAFDNV